MRPMPYDELFAPLAVRHATLRNRIVVPPMVQCRSLTSPEGVAWYRRLCSGEPGLAIVEATGIPHFGNELTAETLRPLVGAIHASGAAAAIQLFPLKFGSDPPPVDGLTKDEIEAILAGYARAAVVCRDAGFDGVEPHGAHGFLLNRFFMPDHNHRTDDYGGSVEARARLGTRIVERIRAAAGNSLLILYRHTSVGQDYGIEESLVLARMLVDAGLDILDISPARGEHVADLAAPFKAALPVPVIAVVGMEDPAAACEALREGRCDLCAIGRGLIADATLPTKMRAGDTSSARVCVRCDACFAALGKREPVVCSTWTEDEVAEYIR